MFLLLFVEFRELMSTVCWLLYMLCEGLQGILSQSKMLIIMKNVDEIQEIMMD